MPDLQIFAASQPIPVIPKHGLRGKHAIHAIEHGFTKDAVDAMVVPQEKQRGTTTESTVATYTGGQGWAGMRWLMCPLMFPVRCNMNVGIYGFV